MAPQFTLYGNVASITSERVRLLLVNQGITDYEFVNLEYAKGEFTTPEHLERHPWGRVPAITLADGTHIYESRSICKYIALANNLPLLPDPKKATALEQALFDQACCVEIEYFSTPACHISGEHSKEFFGMAPDEEKLKEELGRIKAHFEVVDKVLEKTGQGFMAGKEWSVVDIFYVPLVQRLIHFGYDEYIFGQEGQGSGNGNVKEWWRRCMEREAVKKFVDSMVKFEDLQKAMEVKAE